VKFSREDFSAQQKEWFEKTSKKNANRLSYMRQTTREFAIFKKILY